VAARKGQKPAARLPGDGIGIQVPVGRIVADRDHWQTVLESRNQACIYRLHNTPPRRPAEAANAMIVEVDGAKRTIRVAAGCSLDVQGKRIRVKAGTGGRENQTVEGWYVHIS
jgi:hypothetical protein